MFGVVMGDARLQLVVDVLDVNASIGRLQISVVCHNQARPLRLV